MQEDQSTRTLAVILGASRFPRYPQLHQGPSFYNSAAGLMEYLEDAKGMGLPSENILWLFDDSESPSEQLVEIAEFLTRRDAQLKTVGTRAEDLLIYYVGHGLFTRGAEQAYCLALRNTNLINEGATSMRAAELAGVVKENAAFMRRYLILDCCFAASIYREFQSGPLTAASVQIKKEFPERGTAVMCSSNAYEPARAPLGLDRTMFSGSLIRALRAGDKRGGPQFSFSELGDLIRDDLSSSYPETWVRPEVHSPDQRQGNVAHLPLFPNPAYVPPAAAKRTSTRVAASLTVETAKKVEPPAGQPPKPAEEARRSKAAEKRRPDQPHQKKPLSAPGAQSNAPAKRAKAVVEKKVKRPAPARSFNTRAQDDKSQIAAQKAAEKLFVEWRKRERAREVERKRQARERAEERRQRQLAAEEQERKELLARQEAAADRELERMRRERAKLAGRDEIGRDEPEKKVTPPVRPTTTNQGPQKRPETPLERKERLARQDAAAERELERMRRERAKLAGRAEIGRAEPEKKVAPPVQPTTTNQGPQKRPETPLQRKERLARQNAAAERELERMRRERAEEAEQRKQANQPFSLQSWLGWRK
jgi:hypothetical protein